MPEFMVMILANEAEEARLAPSETKALVEGHSRYERELREASVFRDGERLRPSAEGRRVSLRDGQLRVDSGPFAELALGAYHVVEAENLEAAVALAGQCPLGQGASVEVRPVMNGHLKPEKAGQQGRIFSFSVLGNAQSEQAWTELMDRIDACTRDGFPADRFLGGVRLHAPARGKMAATGGRRAVFDGPFLESKEVIGGLFFLRLPTLEEAVRWAGQSEFMKHGTLEIRELWRS